MTESNHALPAATAEGGERGRWVALVVLCVGMLMIVLDATVVNVALPAMRAGLHLSVAGLQWTIDAYLVTLSALLLFGDDAGFEAASRADRSRSVGNHLHFCRWRQIERLIVLMSVGRAVGTVH